MIDLIKIPNAPVHPTQIRSTKEIESLLKAYTLTMLEHKGHGGCEDFALAGQTVGILRWVLGENNEVQKAIDAARKEKAEMEENESTVTE